MRISDWSSDVCSSDLSGRRGDWVSLSDISPAVQKAVILSEDHRFYSHSGVDWFAIAGAAWDDVVHGAHRGASPITMQLAGFIADDSIGRESLWASVCQYVSFSVVAV